MNILKKTSLDLIKCSKIHNLFPHKQISSYKSAISLEHLYPNSSLRLTTPEPPTSTDGFSGYIPIEELEITYSKSTGPGGQNVNKVNTKVDIRFHLQSAKWLSDEAKQKLTEKFKSKLTKGGYLIYKSDITRSQQLNVADCLEKIRSSVRNSLAVHAEPTVESQERARRRLERAAKERLIVKREKSQIKNDRRGSNIEI